MCKEEDFDTPEAERDYMPLLGEMTVSEDPWKHRSQGMRCKTCMFFVPKERSDQPGLGEGYHLGRCRKHAPSMNGFPVVFVNDWCGDHKLDENKI